MPSQRVPLVLTAVAVVALTGLTLVVLLAREGPPPLGPLPSVSAHDGEECRRVLVVGDSIAEFVGQRIGPTLEASGRCAQVTNVAVAGSGVVDWLPGGRFDLARTLAAQPAPPDFVLAFFVGNESFSGLKWVDPSWHDATTAAALALVDLVPDGSPVYWAVPPRSAWRCDWGSLNDRRWMEWSEWLRDELPEERPDVSMVDWRTVFGGDRFSREYVFPDGETRSVRVPDCVHFDHAGADVAATLAVAAMQDEWPPQSGPEPPAVSPEPTTAP